MLNQWDKYYLVTYEVQIIVFKKIFCLNKKRFNNPRKIVQGLKLGTKY